MYRLKVTSKVELKKTSRMAAQAGSTIPPTEHGLSSSIEVNFIHPLSNDRLEALISLVSL